MKKKFAFLIIVFLVLINFQSWTKAGDISDFEIEGISIGESLLEHFSEEEILANEVNYYDDDYFITSEFSG